MKQIKLTALLFILTFVVGCSEDQENPESKALTQGDIAFNVEYYETFENVIYPSLILGFSKMADDLDFFEISLTNPRNEDITVQITISENTVVEKTVLTETLSPGVNSFEFSPNWNFESLKYLDQPGKVNFKYSIEFEGSVITTLNKPMDYRSVGECIYGINDKEDGFIDTKFMFAAYVNEDNPKIDEFLAEAKGHKIVSSYKGYQGTSNEVLEEVFSLWYALQKRNTQYSSITTTSNASSNVFAQNVRFFDQVLQNSSANCVDGSVFLASILMKLGIDPILVLVPGHMYMGFYASANQKDLYLLETTMIGNVDINSIQTSSNIQAYANLEYYSDAEIAYYNQTCNAGNCDVEYMRKPVSRDSFYKALNAQSQNFNGLIDQFNDDSVVEYQVFNIKSLRKVISPIGR